MSWLITSIDVLKNREIKLLCMKYKIIRIVGSIAMLLLACMQSAIILWNYGRTGMGIYDPSYDSGEFSWSTIIGTDWLGWSLSTIGFILLVIPWIQLLIAMERQHSLRTTLSGKPGFVNVFFTVFNISLIIGGLFLLFKGGNMHDMMFGYDRLMMVLEVAVLVYTPWALFVIIGNMMKCRLDSQNHDAKYNKVWHWMVSCIFFILLGVYSFDGWYNWRYDFYCGRASQCIDGKWGYIDRFHRVAVPHIYDHAWDFCDGLACVGIGEKSNDKYGYIDRHGNIVIPMIYDSPAEFINGVAYVEKDGKYGTINTEGQEMIPIIYDWVGFHFPENNGLAQVKLGDRRGFVKSNGDVAIPIVYEDCEYFFCEDMVRAKLYGKWGYLDRKGDVVIPMIYDEAGNFKNGKAEVQLHEEVLYIDAKGQKCSDK